MNSQKHNKRMEFKYFVLVGIVLLHVATFPIRAAMFTTSDLEGNWEVHMLTSGDYPQWTGWMYGTLDIDSSGNARFSSIKRSDGYSSLPKNVMAAVSPSGLVSFAGTDFYGVMNSQKDMIIGVMSDSGGGYDLVAYTKHGTSPYTISDFEGTWYVYGLDSGDAPQGTGWTHATVTIDSSGSFSMSSYLNSKGEADAGESGTFNITSTGIITIPGRPSSHGIINQNKDVLVLVGDSNGGGYSLSIVLKQGTSIFATNDLKGTWELLELTSGDWPQHTGWAHGIRTIDADGNCSFTSMTRSNRDSTVPEDITVAISSSGVVTHAATDFHGIMNSQKDMIVGVMTEGWGGYDMIINTRGLRVMYSFASCSAASTNKYNPCAVGYSWTYDGFGEYSGYTKTVEVISTEPVYGVSCLKVRAEDPVEGLRYAWIAEDMQGNAHIFKFQYESQPPVQINSEDDIPNIHMIANPKVGNTWSRDFDGFGMADFEVESLDATAGEHENCMKVKVDYSGEIHSCYYKEGIGLVKDELWETPSGYILKSFTQAN